MTAALVTVASLLISMAAVGNLAAVGVRLGMLIGPSLPSDAHVAPTLPDIAEKLGILVVLLALTFGRTDMAIVGLAGAILGEMLVGGRPRPWPRLLEQLLVTTGFLALTGLLAIRVTAALA